MYARNVLRTRESTRFHRMWKTLFPSVRIESQSTCTIWNPIFLFLSPYTYLPYCAVSCVQPISVMIHDHDHWPDINYYGRKQYIYAIFWPQVSTHSHRSFIHLFDVGVYVLRSLQVQSNHYLQLCWFTVAASETCARRSTVLTISALNE